MNQELPIREHDDDIAGEPDTFGSPAEHSVADETVGHPGSSLTDDVVALIDDGKTYAEAELAFQKTRLKFAASKGGSGVGMAVAALAFVHLALIALVVGLVIALSPILTPWGATALVVVILLVLGVVAGLAAKKRFSHLSDAYKDTSP
ncbi:hypothetical protein HME9302_01075 [Alteripontixanthobacter maritimus]|uniref:Phage holin family protein n=1 Tax=Alteripontixanthobacter maritimus TaxID=2161824 RepID=A0A369QAD6_9SPHN|nr:phage holin family protein [Alteripontixanthobacter maritimus]RDC59879.1 hypothetical protein HME9302_01075 [Alteripontixanthobacter maritimus]